MNRLISANFNQPIDMSTHLFGHSRSSADEIGSLFKDTSLDSRNIWRRFFIFCQNFRHLLVGIIAFPLFFYLGDMVQAEEINHDVIHWWTSSGEVSAVNVLIDAFEREGGQWNDRPITEPETARSTGVSRVFSGDPPMAMQFNTGKQFDELVANSLLLDLEDLAARERWAEKLPFLINEAVRREGRYYAAPINIHGDNWFWANKKVFDEAGIEVPTSFPELIAAGPALQRIGVSPLALGTQPWQRQLLFSAILLAEAGPATYLALFGDDGIDALHGDAFRKAVEVFLSMRDLVDNNSEVDDWSDATKLVIDGKAALQVMGDWAKGEFIAAELVPGKDYDCVVPSSHHGYIISGDVFVFPRMMTSNNEAQQLKLASLVMSKEIQASFNHKKGSLPARLDVDVSTMDICAKQAAGLIKDRLKQIPSKNYLIDSDLGSTLDQSISELWNNDSTSVDDVIDSYEEVLTYLR